MESVLAAPREDISMYAPRIITVKINPEKIRNIFLGLNDGLVEILGAVSGFFGAFGSTTMVLIAASTSAVAGALSMAAGEYVSVHSQSDTERADLEHPLRSFQSELCRHVGHDVGLGDGLPVADGQGVVLVGVRPIGRPNTMRSRA